MSFISPGLASSGFSLGRSLYLTGQLHLGIKMAQSLCNTSADSELLASILQAKSPEEFGDLLKNAYNRLYATSHQLEPRQDFPVKSVYVLGQLTAPKVHEWHFDFRNRDLDISKLVWKVQLFMTYAEEPSREDSNLYNKFFTCLYKGHHCSSGNMRGSGFEVVSQYTLPLSLFPEMQTAVKEYHALVIAPYKAGADEMRKQAYPALSYLCRA